MALFTDGPISCIEDLTAQDSQLLSVASVEGIDTTQKSAIAQEEVAMDLIGALRRNGCPGHLFWLAPQFKLDNVVVTPSLKLWHTARALELFYQDAYNNQLNDRYAGKRNQFHDLAKWAFGKLIEIGVGIAGTPVPRAAIPVLAPFTGALPDGVYYVTMAWVNRIGEEGAPATATTIATTSSTFLVEPVNAEPRRASKSRASGAPGKCGRLERLRGGIARCDVPAKRHATFRGTDMGTAGHFSSRRFAPRQRAEADLLTTAAADLTERLNDTPHWKRRLRTGNSPANRIVRREREPGFTHAGTATACAARRGSNPNR